MPEAYNFGSTSPSTKTLSRQLVTWGKLRDETVDNLETESWTDNGADPPAQQKTDVVELCKLGISSPPEAFVQRASLAGHPKELISDIASVSIESMDTEQQCLPHEARHPSITLEELEGKMCSWSGIHGMTP